ncbi:ABC transporter permease [Neolewinella agarilytica]|uniref:Putative ABC transport system permease protein n=1 Tax=Neolewinella agarilytica TaxID=478744 RepID=A0A1H9HLT2_9BACT|nr:FtsX-like permease family protein [Neolewinella agarilytica]SEQ63267.1 putative ABC transport system permease protein [Neolewinella agarilytica]
MNLLSLAWKNLTFKPLSALLSVLLFALSIGLISLLLNLRQQADEQFDNNLAGINLVVGAKGSPLELTLNSMYHVGYATGNVTLKEVRSFFNPKHPIVADAVPLSVGDSYRGYRIVGTIPKLLDWYGASLASGERWDDDFEVVVGAEVAAKNGLGLGDKFRSNHGIIDEGEDNIEHDDEFTVVGILAPSGTVMDQIVLTTNQTYWHSHGEHEGEDHAEHDHEDHAGHNHGKRDIQALLEAGDDQEITSVLVRYRNPSSFQALNFPRNINENTGLLAANPAYEISEVRRQFDSGQRILGILVLAITIVSALSIFISLFNSLRDRRYELALLRVMGAGRGKLFSLIIVEGLMVAVIGYILGLLLSHGILYFIASSVSDDFRYSLDPARFLPEEWWLLVGALLIGFVAAVLPATQAARTEIGETLMEG